MGSRPQWCFLKMNIDVYFAHALWQISLWKTLHSSITHYWPALYSHPSPSPPQWNCASIGAPHFLLTLVRLNWWFSMSFHSQFLLYERSSAGRGTPLSPLSELVLFYFIPHSMPPFPHSSAWDGSYSISTCASQSGLWLLYCIPHSLSSPLFSTPLLG